MNPENELATKLKQIDAQLRSVGRFNSVEYYNALEPIFSNAEGKDLMQALRIIQDEDQAWRENHKERFPWHGLLVFFGTAEL